MLTHTEAVLAVARQEVLTALRGRMLLGFCLLFTLLSVGIALAGLGGSGQLLVQGFTRTGVSMLPLSVYLLPLLGLLLGASALGGEDGGAELVLAQPLGRTQVLLGRALGLGAALSAAGLVGLAAAGALVGATAGSVGLGGYLVVVAGAVIVGNVGLALGILLGVATRTRGAALAWALTAWFAAAVLYDLAAIGVLQMVGSGEPGPWLVAILALNPLDGVRAVALVTLGADILLGPTGAALKSMMGLWGGAGWVLASVLLWVVGPLAAAAWLYGRRDF